MNHTHNGHEVTVQNPCPICQKPDWCYLLGDGAVVCGRTETAPPGWAILKTPAKDGRPIFRPIRYEPVPRKRSHIATWQQAGPRDVQTSAVEQEILFEYSPTQRVLRKQWSDRRAVYASKKITSKHGKSQQSPSKPSKAKTKLVRPQYKDNDRWKWGKGPNPWPLYRENDIAPGDIVFFVGGELCVETLRQWGFSATCHQGGEGTYLQETVQRLKHLQIRALAIWPDHDSAGTKAAEKLQDICQQSGIPVAILNPLEIIPNAPPKWDSADWTVEPQEARERLKAIVANLKFASSVSTPQPPGKIPKLAKLYRAVESLWAKDLRFNELTNQIEFKGIAVEDPADLRLSLALHHNIESTVADCDTIIKCLAKLNYYHPVQEYLECCSRTYGTSTEILNGMAQRYFGCSEPMYQTFLVKTLVAAVARIFEPGCKVDTAFILQGPQGYRKSSFFRTLAGSTWFDDSMGSANERDERLKLHQFWFIEWGEMEGILKKKDTSGVKAFLSCQVDTVRPPYGRQAISLKRRSIIVGSTNQSEFLSDATGNRRFWVVPVKQPIELELLKRERDRIWAAALAFYRSGYPVFLTPEEEAIAAEFSETYQNDDPWLGRVVTYLREGWREEITTAELLSRALEIEVGHQTKRDQMRVSEILKRLGWTAQRKTIRGTRRRVWVSSNHSKTPEIVPSAEPPEAIAQEVVHIQKTLPSAGSCAVDNQDNLNPQKTDNAVLEES